MDDWRSYRTTGAKCVYVCHDVMSPFSFLFGGHSKIDIADVLLHFSKLLIGYIQTKLLQQGLALKRTWGQTR